MSRWGLVSLIALALAPAAGASPMPAGSLTVQPNTPGAGSHLVVDANGSDAGFRKGQIPVGFEIAFQKGFVLDPTAVPGTCTTDQANKDSCPVNSRLGSGQIDVVLNGATYHAQITFFRATTQNGVIFYFKEPQSGFNGSSVGTVKTIDEAPYGVLLAFDKLPLPDLPPGLDLQLNHLKLDVGAGAAAPVTKPPAKKKPKPKHKKKRRRYYCTKHRGHGKHRRCVKWSTHKPRRHATAHKSAATSFIVNPADCAGGSWSVQLRWAYKDGTQEKREGAASCAGTGQTPAPPYGY